MNTNFNAFKVLDGNEFKAALIHAKGKTKEYTLAVQSLAIAAIFHAINENDSRKADQVLSLLDKAHQTKFANFVTNHSNLARSTPAQRADYKRVSGKVWPKERLFYIKEKYAHSSESLEKNLAHVETVNHVLWLDYTPPKNTGIKPYDVEKGVADILKRAESKTYSAANDLEQSQMEALNSFARLIAKGITLGELEHAIANGRNLAVASDIMPPELIQNNLEKTA